MRMRLRQKKNILSRRSRVGFLVYSYGAYVCVERVRKWIGACLIFLSNWQDSPRKHAYIWPSLKRLKRVFGYFWFNHEPEFSSRFGKWEGKAIWDVRRTSGCRPVIRRTSGYTKNIRWISVCSADISDGCSFRLPNRDRNSSSARWGRFGGGW